MYTMSYQVLARKWRPHNFQQMVGQEHILRMLTNALDHQRLHHAYLFTGTRGVGKTTLARILAKCLNCEIGITSNPCGVCKNCTSIDEGRFLDLIEVDAASRTKVEDTRELLENVHYQAVQGRFKVYLIDEVHMLSGHSFNALLKTLEEPPPYVKFLLATTDPKRLPITILSRCLQFNLKRVPPQQISSHLQHVCSVENIAYETEALQLLAAAADGSMRDALSLLDQTIAYCAEKITTNDTRQMLGSIEQDSLFRLLHALGERDGMRLLHEIESLAEMAPDFSQALEDLLSIFHRISILKVIPDARGETDAIKALADCFTTEDVQLYYQIALLGRRDLPLCPDMQQGFEMILMRMLAFQPVTTEVAPAPINKTSTTTTKAEAAPIKKETRLAPPPAAVSTPGTTSHWTDMLSQLGLTGMAYVLASNCSLNNITDTHVILTLASKHEAILNKKLADRVEEALIRYLKKPIKLKLEIANTGGETPIKRQQQEQIEKQSAAEVTIQNDTEVQKIIGLFNATLSSVTPS
jgi:DNA polymerase-3 subunit gamma/tau